MLRIPFYRILTVAATAAVVAVIAAEPYAAIAQRHTVDYVVGYQTRFRPTGSPWTGRMTLTFNNGIISGRYTDTSLRPGGPLANVRNATVTGGETNGNIRFTIGHHFSVHGTISEGKINGTAMVRSTAFDFHAAPGKLPGQ